MMALEIIPKPDYITWEEITDLLHKAFAERAEQGLTYTACNQPTEETKRRVGDGICMVALLDGKLIGTGSYKIYCRGGKRIGYLSQLGILPDYKGQGIGSELRNRIREEICRKDDIDAIYANTSVKATSVVSWYVNNGWQEVRLESYSTTNYYSYVFRFPVNGRKYSSIEVALRLFLSSIYCKCRIREDGSLRPLGKFLKKAKDYARDKFRGA